jgi:hypothetical protein
MVRRLEVTDSRSETRGGESLSLVGAPAGDAPDLIERLLDFDLAVTENYVSGVHSEERQSHRISSASPVVTPYRHHRLVVHLGLHQGTR